MSGGSNAFEFHKLCEFTRFRMIFNRGSVQFSSLQLLSCVFATHGLQHTRPPCPSPTPGVYSNSCPLCWWYHPTILSSVAPFSSYFQSFPASGSFKMSQLFVAGVQSIGVSASTSVLPMNILIPGVYFCFKDFFASVFLPLISECIS